MMMMMMIIIVIPSETSIKLLFWHCHRGNDNAIVPGAELKSHHYGKKLLKDPPAYHQHSEALLSAPGKVTLSYVYNEEEMRKAREKELPDAKTVYLSRVGDYSPPATMCPDLDAVLPVGTSKLSYNGPEGSGKGSARCFRFRDCIVSLLGCLGGGLISKMATRLTIEVIIIPIIIPFTMRAEIEI
jgi:hypothetical protein